MLYSNKSNNRILAVKVTKGDDDDSDLMTEYTTVKFLSEQKKQIGLHSHIPDAQGLYYINDLAEEIDGLEKNTSDFSTFIDLTKGNKSNLCYCYEADPEYFKYLYDVEDGSDFVASASTAVHDMMLLQEKFGIIFNQLIQAFHGTDRRYKVLTNLIHRKNTLSKGEKGMGRMDAFRNAVSYINIRQTPYPLADLGDWVIQINRKFYKKTPMGMAKTHLFNEELTLSRTIKPWGDQESSVYTVNFLAEYLYTIALSAARRVTDLKNGNWAEASDAIFAVAASQIATINHMNIEEVKQYLEACVDKKRLAAQMEFFMTSKQVEFIENGKIPKELYGIDVKVDLMEDCSKWQKGFGPAINQNEGMDLGPYGGNNPLTELCKLLNITMVTVTSEKYLAYKAKQATKTSNQG